MGWVCFFFLSVNRIQMFRGEGGGGGAVVLH